MVKATLALVAALLTASAPPARPVVPVADGSIVRVECFSPLGNTVGSAVMIGPGVYVTAAHVIDNGSCGVGPSIARVVHTDQKRDFAIFEAEPVGKPYKVSCKGFRVGDIYLARGFPGGGPKNAWLPWLASWADLSGMTTFVGEAFPGMSGGPVIDKKGRVVGVVLLRHPAASTPLSETPVCQ